MAVGTPDIGVRIKASGSEQIRQQFAMIRRDAEDALVTVDRVANSTSSALTANFNRSAGALNSTSTALSGLANLAQRSLDTVANTFALGLSKIRESAGEAAAGAGLVGVGLGGLVYAARNYSQSVAEATAATGDLADSMSIPIEEFSKLQAAFRLEGGDDAKFGQAMTGLKGKILSLAEGNQTAIDSFASLGLSMQNFRDGKGNLLGTRQQLDLVLDRIEKIKSPTLQAKAVMDAFGVSAGALGSLATSGSAGLLKAEEDVKRYGTVVDQETRDAFDEGLEAQGKLTESLRGTGLSLAKVFFPFFTSSAEGLSNWINGNRDKIEEFLKSIRTVAERIKIDIKSIFTAITAPMSGGRRWGERGNPGREEDDDDDEPTRGFLGGALVKREAIINGRRVDLDRLKDGEGDGERFAIVNGRRVDLDGRSGAKDLGARQALVNGRVVDLDGRGGAKALGPRQALVNGKVVDLDKVDEQGPYAVNPNAVAPVEQESSIEGEEIESGGASMAPASTGGGRGLNYPVLGQIARLVGVLGRAVRGLIASLTSKAFSDFIALVTALGSAATQAARAVGALAGFVVASVRGVTGVSLTFTGVLRTIAAAFRDFRLGLSRGFRTPWAENLRRAANNIIAILGQLAPFAAFAFQLLQGYLTTATAQFTTFTGFLRGIPGMLSGVGPAIAGALSGGSDAVAGLGQRVQGVLRLIDPSALLRNVGAAAVAIGFLTGSLALKLGGLGLLVTGSAMFAGEQARRRMEEGLNRGGGATAGPASFLLGDTTPLAGSLERVLGIFGGFGERLKTFLGTIDAGALLRNVGSAVIAVGFLTQSLTLKLGGLALLVGGSALFAGQQARRRMEEGLNQGTATAGPASFLLGDTGAVSTGLSRVLGVFGGFGQSLRALLGTIDAGALLRNVGSAAIAVGFLTQSMALKLGGLALLVGGSALYAGQQARRRLEEGLNQGTGAAAGPASFLLGDQAPLAGGLNGVLGLFQGFVQSLRATLQQSGLSPWIRGAVTALTLYGVFTKSWTISIIALLGGLALGSAAAAEATSDGIAKATEKGIAAASPASMLGKAFGPEAKGRLDLSLAGLMASIGNFAKGALAAFLGFSDLAIGQLSFLPTVIAVLGFFLRSRVVQWAGFFTLFAQLVGAARLDTKGSVAEMKAAGAEVEAEGARVEKSSLGLVLGRAPAVGARLFGRNWTGFQGVLGGAIAGLASFTNRVGALMGRLAERLGILAPGRGASLGGGFTLLAGQILYSSGALDVLKAFVTPVTLALAALFYTVGIVGTAFKLLTGVLGFAGGALVLFYRTTVVVAVSMRAVWLASFAAVRAAAAATYAFIMARALLAGAVAAAAPYLMVIGWGLVVAAIAVGIVMIIRHFGSITEAFWAACRGVMSAWHTTVRAMGATGDFLAEVWREGFFKTMGQLIVDLWHGFANMGIWAWNQIKKYTGLSKVFGKTQYYGSDAEIQEQYNKSLRDYGLVDGSGTPRGRMKPGADAPVAPTKRAVEDPNKYVSLDDIVTGSDGVQRVKREEIARLQAAEDERYAKAMEAYAGERTRYMEKTRAAQQKADADVAAGRPAPDAEKKASAGVLDEMKKALLGGAVGPDGKPVPGMLQGLLGLGGGADGGLGALFGGAAGAKAAAPTPMTDEQAAKLRAELLAKNYAPDEAEWTIRGQMVASGRDAPVTEQMIGWLRRKFAEDTSPSYIPTRIQEAIAAQNAKAPKAEAAAPGGTGGFLDALVKGLLPGMPGVADPAKADPAKTGDFVGDLNEGDRKGLPDVMKRMEELLRESQTTGRSADGDPYGTGMRGAEDAGDIRVERRASLGLGGALAGLTGGLSGATDFSDGVPEPIVLDAQQRAEIAKRKADAAAREEEAKGKGQDLRKLAFVFEEGSLVGTQGTVDELMRKLNELGIRTRTEPARIT